jgi:Thioesterase-like superfamily
VQASFFEPIGPGTYRATPATAGPWSEYAQHGGPPSALAARALERHEPDDGTRLARVAVDILRPVPVDTLTVRTRILRPGKRVALLEAVLESGGREVLIARGWRIAKSDDVPVVSKNAALPAIPASQAPPSFPGGYVDGYLAHIDWRLVSGSFAEPGPCQAWGRARIPLLPDEDFSPMCRSLLLADSGSGLSLVVDPMAFVSINVDLTVVLQRDPAGEWLLLDSLTTMGGNGTALAETVLSDASGPCGRGLQTLLVAPR